MDCSLPGSSVHGILQARILEWVAIPFSTGSSWPRDWTWVSCIAGRFFTVWAIGKSHSFLLGTAQSPKLPGSLPWDVPNPFVSNLWFIWPQRLLSSWTGIPLFYSEEMEKHQCGIGFILKLGNKHCIEWEHSSVKPLPTGEAKRDTVEQSKETNRSLLCVMAALFSPGSGCVSPCLCVGSLPAQPWSYHLCYFVITVGKPLFKGDRYTSS